MSLQAQLINFYLQYEGVPNEYLSASGRVNFMSFRRYKKTPKKSMSLQITGI